MICVWMMATAETKTPVSVGALSKSDVCAKWKGVGWSSKDTDQTIREVKENNKVRTEFCS
jgi:hypothetical protein